MFGVRKGRCLWKLGVSCLFWVRRIIIVEGVVKGTRTKDFPALTEPLPVLRIDNVRYGVTVIVVSVPDGPNATLSSEVEEVYDAGWEGYFTRCVSNSH